MSTTSETPKQEPGKEEIINLTIRKMAIQNAIDLILLHHPDLHNTASELIEIRDEFEQQLKDLKFDHDNFVNETLKTE